MYPLLKKPFTLFYPNCMMVEEFCTLNTATLFCINTLNHWGSVNNLLSYFWAQNHHIYRSRSSVLWLQEAEDKPFPS